MRNMEMVLDIVRIVCFILVMIWVLAAGTGTLASSLGQVADSLVQVMTDRF